MTHTKNQNKMSRRDYLKEVAVAVGCIAGLSVIAFFLAGGVGAAFMVIMATSAVFCVGIVNGDWFWRAP